MLPHAYTLRANGVHAEYMHSMMVTAIEDFSATLPGGGADYREELREFVLRLYEKAAAEGDRYFVDKSPPYCLVAEEIIGLFPEAKCVFLWRNPLSVVASMIKTWGPWHPTFMCNDLFIGLPRLIGAYGANRERCHAARFEDLVGGEEGPWRALTEYLGIEFEPSALTDFASVELTGRMGDPTGRRRYSSLSAEPGEKWKGTLVNPLRRAWCRRYLRFLGDERLATMGYDRERLVSELDAQPPGFDDFAVDLGRSLKDVLKEPIRVRTSARQVGGPSAIRELIGS